jgi:hypothetical protein
LIKSFKSTFPYLNSLAEVKEEEEEEKHLEWEINKLAR